MDSTKTQRPGSATAFAETILGGLEATHATAGESGSAASTGERLASGRFAVGRTLGEGGMGSVLEAPISRSGAAWR